MKVTDHIKKAKGKTLFSFEIIPPKKGQNINELYSNIDPLMEFKPPLFTDYLQCLCQKLKFYVQLN